MKNILNNTTVLPSINNFRCVYKVKAESGYCIHMRRECNAELCERYGYCNYCTEYGGNEQRGLCRDCLGKMEARKGNQ